MRCSELPSLAHSAEELFAGLGQLHEPRSPIKHAHQDDPRSGDRACADGAAIERIQLPPEDTAAAAGKACFAPHCCEPPLAGVAAALSVDRCRRGTNTTANKNLSCLPEVKCRRNYSDTIYWECSYLQVACKPS